MPVVRTGRKALAKQMTAMLMNVWHRHHHVCENFNPHKDGTECTGDHFYHWVSGHKMVLMSKSVTCSLASLL